MYVRQAWLTANPRNGLVANMVTANHSNGLVANMVTVNCRNGLMAQEIYESIKET